jgi:outer membrane protein assembly factor BamB
VALARAKTGLVFTAVVFFTACQTQGTSPPIAVHSLALSPKTIEDTTEQSVAYQINNEHNGYARGPLHLPLKQLWAVNIGGKHGDVQYPVIANGIVVVIANGKLTALNEKTGKVLWTHNQPNVFGWVGPAYDNGMIFASANVGSPHKRIGMFGFDERTGEELWSAKQSGGGSPPTAASGVVYGGALSAYDESSGAINWTASLGGDGDSSPVVTSAGIFVSYACPQTYDLQPGNGTQIWHYGPSSCEGGGGSTPVLYDGLLFVEDIYSFKYSGVIVSAKSGAVAGHFNSTAVPAFANHLGFFVDQSTLTAQTIPGMKTVWSDSLETSDGYETPPIVVGNIVYLGTIANTLVGYDASTGKQKVLVALPTSSFYQAYSGSLAYGDGELLVPNGTYLVAFKGS